MEEMPAEFVAVWLLARQDFRTDGSVMQTDSLLGGGNHARSRCLGIQPQRARYWERIKRAAGHVAETAAEMNSWLCIGADTAALGCAAQVYRIREPKSTGQRPPNAQTACVPSVQATAAVAGSNR